MPENSIFQSAITAPLNHICERVLGGRLDLTHVIEYPKCGGTWLARILRSYRGVERARGTTQVLCRGAILQRHALPAARFRKVVVIVRDPRDVWVSYYFHETHLNPDRSLMSRIGYDPAAAISLNLENYIREKLEHPSRSGPRFSYEAFTNAWWDHPNVTRVSYEDMSEDTVAAMSGVIDGLGWDRDDDRLCAAISEHEFKNITGRALGEEDRFSHKRKGIVGDWRNYFTDELQALVEERQGALMKHLGYV